MIMLLKFTQIFVRGRTIFRSEMQPHSTLSRRTPLQDEANMPPAIDSVASMYDSSGHTSKVPKQDSSPIPGTAYPFHSSLVLSALASEPACPCSVVQVYTARIDATLSTILIKAVRSASRKWLDVEGDNVKRFYL